MFVEFCVLVIENEALNVLLVFEYAVLVGVIMTMMLPLESIVRDNLMWLYHFVGFHIYKQFAVPLELDLPSSINFTKSKGKCED